MPEKVKPPAKLVDFYLYFLTKNDLMHKIITKKIKVFFINFEEVITIWIINFVLLPIKKKTYVLIQ